MKSIITKTSNGFLLIILMIAMIPSTASSQQIGLEVDSIFTVVFGADTTNRGTRFMYMPNRGGAILSGHLRENAPNPEFWNPQFLGLSSATFGVNSRASGDASMVWGGNNNALSSAATAFGESNEASSAYSTSWGFRNKATSFLETTFGRYAEVSNGDPFSWIENQPLLSIGNGTSDDLRNNAFTILKNGNIGINESNPGTLLHIESDQASGRSIALSLVAGASKRPSIQFSEFPGLSGSLNSGMSIEYDGRLGTTENKIYINSIETATAGSGLPVVTFKNDGDTDINGFVKIGDEATAVKYKTIILNTPNNSNFSSSANHGLDQTKIIGMQASLVDGLNTLFPNDRISAWSYTVRITGAEVRIEIESGSTITDKPVTVTLTYIE